MTTWYFHCTFALSKINDMGATHQYVTELQVRFPAYLACVNCDFRLDIEATVFFGEEEDRLKAADDCHVSRLAFGSATLQYNDLPKEMREEIKGMVISHAYDILNAETLKSI